MGMSIVKFSEKNWRHYNSTTLYYFPTHYHPPSVALHHMCVFYVSHAITKRLVIIDCIDTFIKFISWTVFWILTLYDDRCGSILVQAMSPNPMPANLLWVQVHPCTTGQKPIKYPLKNLWSNLHECKCYYFFNSLWPRDTIWQHWSGSTLAQVMTCCMTAHQKIWRYQSVKQDWKWHFQNYTQISQGSMS